MIQKYSKLNTWLVVLSSLVCMHFHTFLNARTFCCFAGLILHFIIAIQDQIDNQRPSTKTLNHHSWIHNLDLKLIQLNFITSSFLKLSLNLVSLGNPPPPCDWVIIQVTKAKRSCCLLIFLGNIESHSLRRMGTPGPGPQCGLNLVLSDHSVEWWYLVLDYDMDLALPWRDSILCWVTILFNGRHLVRDHDVDQSSIGRLNLVLSIHSFNWRHLVSY